MKLYIAGPMTGYPGFNFPAFHAAARVLRAQGHDAVSPAEQFGGNTTLPYQVYTRHDAELILTVEGIVLLDGWGKSTGAKTETALGLWLGLPFFYLDGDLLQAMKPENPVHRPAAPSGSVLLEAEGLVHGDRQASYGHPLDDFTRTAAMASALFGWDMKAEDVGMFLALVKLSRQRNHPKRDNMTDLAGYAETVQMVIDERARRSA